MGWMFNECYKLKEIKGIKNFNTFKVIKMDKMFQECRVLEYLDLTNFDTSNVKDMEGMFNHCYNLKEIKGINNFNLSKVTLKSGMFSECYKLKGLNLSHFGISSSKNPFDDDPNKKGNPIKITFSSTDQNIQYTITCYKTDDFSKIEKELYEKNPELKSKKDVYFFGNGGLINKFATLEQNGIKNDAIILINY